MAEISVVIPTAGRRDTLVRVLDGYAAQTAAGEFELIVVTDAACENPAAVWQRLEGRPYPARCLAASVAGASGARNVGWRAARAPLVLFSDDDIIPDPGFVAAHLEAHRKRPASEDAALGLIDWASELRVTPFMRWLDRGIQFEYDTIEGEDAGWGRFYTANASVKRELLERVDGFDELRLPFGYEDLDIAKRMADVGMRVWYVPDAFGQHLQRPTLTQWRQQARRIARAERAFVAKHPDVPPYFHDRLSFALEIPPQRRWGSLAANAIPRSLPWLGWRIWWRAETYFGQQVGGEFMDAWQQEPQEAVSAARASSGGSAPGGPK